MKIIINRCRGGFDVSDEALAWIRNRFGDEIPQGVDDEDLEYYILMCMERHHPILVECFEALGSKMMGREWSELFMWEGKDDQYWIEECDGRESVRTNNCVPWKNPSEIKLFEIGQS